MMPFVPEPLEDLKARFPKCLEKVWDITDTMPDRPGLHREHVFDFESGMRLLISNDCMIPRAPDIHISASWEHNPPQSILEMETDVVRGYRALGGKGLLRLLGWSGRGIPHWIVEKES
jgi:hypothetical protein